MLSVEVEILVNLSRYSLTNNPTASGPFTVCLSYLKTNSMCPRLDATPIIALLGLVCTPCRPFHSCLVFTATRAADPLATASARRSGRASRVVVVVHAALSRLVLVLGDGEHR